MLGAQVGHNFGRRLKLLGAVVLTERQRSPGGIPSSENYTQSPQLPIPHLSPSSSPLFYFHHEVT